jgi:nuclear pore complex protein Nup107
MSDSAIYASSAEVLSMAQLNKDDLATLLDPQSGFAPKMRQICQEQLVEVEESGDGRYSAEELEALRMESDTWGLLQAVMP